MVETSGTTYKRRHREEGEKREREREREEETERYREKEGSLLKTMSCIPSSFPKPGGYLMQTLPSKHLSRQTQSATQIPFISFQFLQQVQMS
jgi:hypothetical protein